MMNTNVTAITPQTLKTAIEAIARRDTVYVRTSRPNSSLKAKSLPIGLTPTTVLRPPEASLHVGLAPQTLANLRLSGSGPPYVKIGLRAVGYRLSDLDEWLAKQVRSSTSDPGKPMA